MIATIRELWSWWSDREFRRANWRDLLVLTVTLPLYLVCKGSAGEETEK